MHIITVPASLNALSFLAEDVSRKVRVLTGTDPVVIYPVTMEKEHALLMIFCNDSGKMHAVRFNLPVDIGDKINNYSSVLLQLLDRLLATTEEIKLKKESALKESYSKQICKNTSI